MKIQDVTPEIVKDLSNRQLTSLHWRLHQLWAQRKSKKMNMDLLKSKHQIIIKQMKERGLKHIEHTMKRVMSKLTEYLGEMS